MPEQPSGSKMPAWLRLALLPDPHLPCVVGRFDLVWNMVLEFGHAHRSGFSVHRTLLIAMLLVLNHSFMFGVAEAALLPDENHPFGKAVQHEHLHHHAHRDMHEQLHEQVHEHSPEHSHNAGQQQSDSPAIDDDQHEHHHEHATHVQLNFDLPSSLSLIIQKHGSDALTAYHLTHQSLTYAPPVPPPNH